MLLGPLGIFACVDFSAQGVWSMQTREHAMVTRFVMLQWDENISFFRMKNQPKSREAGGALRKFVASCAPKLGKIAEISFRASHEGCAKLSRVCRKFESEFRTILCKYLFSNDPFLKTSEKSAQTLLAESSSDPRTSLTQITGHAGHSVSTTTETGGRLA